MAYIHISVISQHFNENGVRVDKKAVDNTFFMLEIYEWCQIKVDNFIKISNQIKLTLTLS